MNKLGSLLRSGPLAMTLCLACSNPVVWRQSRPRESGSAGSGAGERRGPSFGVPARCVSMADLGEDSDMLVGSPAPPGAVRTLRIHDLQGRGHESPYVGAEVTGIAGIVTALTLKGFSLQSESPDNDPGTSEGIFVVLGSKTDATVGDRVVVSGTVTEAGAPPSLTVTQLSGASVVVQSSYRALPEAVVIGHGGRCPPTELIEASGGDILASSAFDPIGHGIDFYESLEAMRVTVEEAVAASGTSDYGEIAVLPNDGTWVTHRTERGGVYVTPADRNPERILLDNALVPGEPSVQTGDRFTAPITGILGYSHGNFKLLNVEPLPNPRTSSADPGPTDLVGDDAHVTVATLNVDNLAPDESTRLGALGRLFSVTLRAPDIVVLQEIQDDNGAAPGVLTASATYSGLASAIAEAGGPSYQWRDIAPSGENADGGLPNGNIRVGMLFNPKRITFVDRGSAGPTDAVGLQTSESGLALTLSPARLAPSDAAWSGSRKPLVAEFDYRGQRLILIGCHFRSKVGDSSLFGAEQPPLTLSSSQRLAQAQVVARFVDSALSSDPDARLVVLGDLNDFDFSDTLDVLVEASLVRLTDTLSPDQRYSYVYDGNAQLLDHLLVSPALEAGAALEIVHVNADSAAQDRPTDHDPVVARLRMAP